MDSVTQFALGAVIGAVTLGPRIGPRKAVIIGGLMGTVPDLDTFIPSDDPVSAFTSHRGTTHSLVIQALATPLFAEPLVRIFQGLRDQRIRTYAAIYSIFATHALIDAITIYGTRLLYPVIDTPYGVGSMFIIDPLYTLPLVVITLWGLLVATSTPRFFRWCKGVLAVTTAYMALSIPLQHYAEAKAVRVLNERGIEPERVLTLAAPFTTLFFKTVAIDGSRYINLYTPLFGDEDTITAYVHPRRADLVTCLATDPRFQELAAFTKGFFSLRAEDGNIIMSDLRMGLTPNYVFQFAIAETTADGTTPLDTPTREPVIRESEGDTDWLIAGILASPTTRTAEAENEVALSNLGPRQKMLAMTRCGLG